MPNFERANKWLTFAARDLGTAKALVNLPDPDFYFSSFACQQSAEKSIKAFLAFHDQRIFKTHKIEQLILLVAEIDSQVSKLVQNADSLTPYAVAIRYPGADILVDKDTTSEAVSIAQKTYDVIFKFINKDKV